MQKFKLVVMENCDFENPIVNIDNNIGSFGRPLIGSKEEAYALSDQGRACSPSYPKNKEIVSSRIIETSALYGFAKNQRF